MERIGWDTIVGRAHAAVRELPASTVLGGFSMGMGVIGSLWPDRPGAAGVFLLHATTAVPEGVPIGTPVQAHVADGDPLIPSDQLAAFRTSAAHAGVEAALHTYASAGHFYTDPSLPDYNPVAAARTWQHIDVLPRQSRQRASPLTRWRLPGCGGWPGPGGTWWLTPGTGRSSMPSARSFRWPTGW